MIFGFELNSPCFFFHEWIECFATSILIETLTTDYVPTERRHLELASVTYERLACTVASYIAFNGDSFGRFRCE